MKHVVFGDVHGEITLLESLLDRVHSEIEFGPECCAVFLGDLIDRGHDPYSVVERVRSEPGAKVLRGNHEQMMIIEAGDGSWISKQTSLWGMNGGRKTIDSYGGTWPAKNRWLQKFETEHGKWMRELPVFYETPDLWFSHAPVSNQQAFRSGLHRTNLDDLLWNSPVREGRDESRFAVDMGAQRQVVGHVHALHRGVTVPRIYPHIIYADTGCGCSSRGVLTALALDGRYCEGYYQAHPDGPVSYTPVNERGDAE